MSKTDNKIEDKNQINKEKNNDINSSTKNVYFSNIPRRKIYEEMLIFEDGLMELDILQYNQSNFDKYHDKYNDKALKKMHTSFINIKATMIMFLENRKYRTESEHNEDLKKLIENQKETNINLRKNKIISIKQKYLIAKLNYIFNKHQIMKNLRHAKSSYKTFVKFNDELPKILEYRREFKLAK